MADKGYIKIDRKILEWRWATHPNTAWMFITLLLMANYQDHDFENITIHRGQVATSIGKLAEKTGTSYAQARRTLVNMSSTGELTITRYSRFLVITIVKYDEYQSIDNHLKNRCKSFAKQMTIISQQSNKDNKSNKRKESKKGANAPNSPPGKNPDRDSGTVEDIPTEYRDGTFAEFKSWTEYWDWRNQ